MRVLQVHTPYRQPGGEDTVVAAEADVLRKAGHEVRQLLVPNPESTLRSAASLVQAPLNVHSARRAASVTREWRPDVVHVHNTWFALSPAVLPAVRRHGAPTVMTLHNYRIGCANALLFRDGHPCQDCLPGRSWPGVLHGCYRGSRIASVPAAATISLNRWRRTWERHVDVFLASTQFTRSRFVAAGLPPERVVVRPLFSADPGRRPAAPSTSNSLLYVGRLTSEKGVVAVVDAARSVAEDGLELVVVGGGPLEDECRRRAGPNVRFRGWTDPSALARMMKASRALLFPSRWYETFGLVMIEAMAAGLPVVSTGIGGAPEVVGPDAGWTVDHDDARAWAIALRAVLDGDAVDARGAAARRRWEANYAPRVGLSSLEGAYATAVEVAGARRAL